MARRRLEYKELHGQYPPPFATLKLNILALLTPLFLAVFAAAAFGSSPDPTSADASNEVVEKYVQAATGHENSALSMEVNISASVPKLNQHGQLHARRVISRVGRITYRVLGFQGSNTVKTQIIARYLQAEQQGQSSGHLAITPVNYKFKLKGLRTTVSGENVYVLALTPRRRETGLFRGELWVDSHSYLPVYERGRLVKNPSIFFKKVDFERAFVIQGGAAVPQYMNSTISTRLVGKVELDVSYSNFTEAADIDDSMPNSFAAASFSSR